jgi:hypothetical protein
MLWAQMPSNNDLRAPTCFLGMEIAVCKPVHRSHETIMKREAAEQKPLRQAWHKRCQTVLEKTGEIATRQNVVKSIWLHVPGKLPKNLLISALRSFIRPL